MTRRFSIIQRWCQVVAAASVGAGICLIIAPYLHPIASSVKLATNRDRWIAGVVSLLMLVPLAWPVGHGRWRAFLGIRHFLAHPPIWVAGPMGAAIILSIQLVSGKTFTLADNETLWVCLLYGVPGVLLVAVVACLLPAASRLLVGLWRKVRPQVQASPTASPGDPKPLSKSSDLIAWLLTDAEIALPKDDRFEHNEIARRIARRLTNSNSTDEAPTIALVGPLGSGKSTIASLVEYHTSEDQNIEIVRVSLWPFESPEAAVRGILAALIKRLSQHVSTWNLAGLPDQYASSIERVGGHWAALAGLLTGPRQPEEVLKHLEEITLAINVRLVVWIEDLERFANISDKSDQESRSADARLSPVRALLFLLDRCQRISVVVADCSLDARFDLEKISRFIERIPPLDPEQVRREFAAYRDSRLRLREMESIIDPVSSQVRKEFLKETSEWVRRYVRDFTGNLNIESALSTLLSTPRSLKSALRTANEVLDQLKGEIDLDDVLLMSTIRAARPSVFAFLDRNIKAFRSGFMRHGIDNKDPKEHPTYVEFRSILENEKNSLKREAIRRLFAEVFPEIPESGYQMNVDQWCLERPQGLAVTGHTDYWRRYLSLPDICEEESDQVAMRSIKHWQKKEESDLVARLTDEKQSGQVEHFLCLFDSEELLRLLREVAERASSESAHDWNDRKNAPGIIPVWRMMNRRTPRSERVLQTLLDLIGSIDPPHLPLLHTLEYYIATPGGDRLFPLLEEKDRAKVRSAVQDALRRCSSGGAEELLASLREGSPYTILWLAWGDARLGADQTTGQPFKEWPRLATTMLDAADSKPALMLPQIVPFVVSVDYGIGGDSDGNRAHQQVARFNQEAAERLFDFSRLKRILAKSTIPDGITDDIKNRWEVAKQACQE